MLCTIGTSNIENLFNFATCLINKSIIPLIFALAVAAFVWGVVRFFILDAGEEAKRTQGKQFMIWGIIALTVILSVWGIVRLLGNTLDLNTTLLPGVTPDGTSVNPALRCGNNTCEPPGENANNCPADCHVVNPPGPDGL
jgi:uncharacterized membrane protein YjfL (UPF0719 family)